MIKLDRTYSDYTELDDEKYPNGKAVDCTTDESYDGTPIKKELVNDLHGALEAVVAAAEGGIAGVSGQPDNISESDFKNAIKKLIDTPDNAHAALRGIDAHGATVASTPGQLMTRDESGRAQVADPSADEDIVNKRYLNNWSGSNSLTRCAKGMFGTAITKNAVTAFSSSNNTDENLPTAKVVEQNIYGYLNIETKQAAYNLAHNFNIAPAGVYLRDGTTIKVTFTQDCYSATANTAPTDSAYPAMSVDNGTTFVPIYVNQHGTPVKLPAHLITSRDSKANYYWWWQAYTSFELMYIANIDGNGNAGWIIMNSDIDVLSYSSTNESYSVKANGLTAQDFLKGDFSDGWKSQSYTNGKGRSGTVSYPLRFNSVVKSITARSITGSLPQAWAATASIAVSLTGATIYQISTMTSDFGYHDTVSVHVEGY